MLYEVITPFSSDLVTTDPVALIDDERVQVVVELPLGEGEQLARLGAPGLGDRPAPEPADDRQDCEKGVITSYSIHYTKLYEITLTTD